MRTSAYACVAAVAATIVAPVSASAMNEQVSTEATRFTIQKLADGALEESSVTADAAQKALSASPSERSAKQVREAHSAGVN